MKTKAKDDHHPAVPDEADLASTVTMNVSDFIAAVAEAYDNAIDVKAGAEKFGLGHNISVITSYSIHYTKLYELVLRNLASDITFPLLSLRVCPRMMVKKCFQQLRLTQSW